MLSQSINPTKLKTESLHHLPFAITAIGRRGGILRPTVPADDGRRSARLRTYFMAPGQSVRRQRERGGKETSSSETSRTKTKSNVSAAAVESPLENPTDLYALRKARLEYLDKPREERRKTMKYVGEVVDKVPVTKRNADGLRKVSDVRKRHKAASVRKHSHQKERATVPRADEEEDEYVYRPNADVKSNDEDTSKAGIESVVEDGLDPSPRAKSRRKAVADDRNRREERRPLPRRQTEPVRRRNSYGLDILASDRR